MANSTVDMMLDGLETDEESSPFETSVIINSVLNALLIPICIAGNVLVLAAVWRNPSLRTPSTILLCSLAVSDLFVGFLVLPVNIAIALTPLSRSSSLLRLSQARTFLIIQLCGVSLDTMTAISVDRYLALRYHMRYPNLMTSKRAMYVAATFWCKNVILSLLSSCCSCLRCLMSFHFFNYLQCNLSNRSTPSTSDSRPTASRTEYERGTKSQDTSEETRCKHIYILHLYASLLFSSGCLLPNLGDL